MNALEAALIATRIDGMERTLHAIKDAAMQEQRMVRVPRHWLSEQDSTKLIADGYVVQDGWYVPYLPGWIIKW